MKENIIEVIPSEQTPKVPEIDIINSFMIENFDKLEIFLEYAKTREDAAGLAANQISIDGERLMLRAFALKNPDRTWRLIIDPVIDEYIGIKDIKLEGCLTWKNKAIVAERSRTVMVSYYDETGEKHFHEIYQGFDAQVWQHEINHLNGVPEQVEERGFQVPKPIEVGRNEKCPCGSLKKYKHCCLV